MDRMPRTEQHDKEHAKRQRTDHSEMEQHDKEHAKRRRTDHSEMEQHDKEHAKRRRTDHSEADPKDKWMNAGKRLLYDMKRDTTTNRERDVTRNIKIDETTGETIYMVTDTAKISPDVREIPGIRRVERAKQSSVFKKKKKQIEQNNKAIDQKSAQLYAEGKAIDNRSSPFKERVREFDERVEQLGADKRKIDVGRAHVERLRPDSHGTEWNVAQPRVETPMSRFVTKLESAVQEANNDYSIRAVLQEMERQAIEVERQAIKEDQAANVQHKNEHAKVIYQGKEVANTYNKELQHYFDQRTQHKEDLQLLLKKDKRGVL